MEASELIVDAVRDNLPQVLSFLKEALAASGCPKKIQTQLAICVEEVFVNIASYAYPAGKGAMTMRVALQPDQPAVTVTFMDGGAPFDPLEKPDPDISLPGMERKIGGLGIFMTKKAMDDVSYRYEDGQNILTMKKSWREACG